MTFYNIPESNIYWEVFNTNLSHFHFHFRGSTRHSKGIQVGDQTIVEFRLSMLSWNELHDWKQDILPILLTVNNKYL